MAAQLATVCIVLTSIPTFVLFILGLMNVMEKNSTTSGFLHRPVACNYNEPCEALLTFYVDNIPYTATYMCSPTCMNKYPLRSNLVNICYKKTEPLTYSIDHCFQGDVKMGMAFLGISSTIILMFVFGTIAVLVGLKRNRELHSIHPTQRVCVIPKENDADVEMSVCEVSLDCHKNIALGKNEDQRNVIIVHP